MSSYQNSRNKHTLRKGPKKIYFIFNTANTLVKIGQSRNIASRLWTLQRKYKGDLHIIREFKAPGRAEHWLHRYYANQHVGDEWFIFSADMLTIYPSG
jgi:hypothetical protein